MGRIIIEQYIFCDTFGEAKNISKAFENFKFKFYKLGSNSTVYAKRYIRKNPLSKYSLYKVIIRYSIGYEGEFMEYGFLDKRTIRKYPNFVKKLSVEDVYGKINLIHKYQSMENNVCKDIYYYKDFEEFFNDELRQIMNKIYMACVIAFANVYRADCFVIYYTEKNKGYERGYVANDSYYNLDINKYYPNMDMKLITVSTVWKWMEKYHKYKKDCLASEARPLTALTYAINRSDFERVFYSVVGLESVFTKDEKKVRSQLKKTISKVFSNISIDDIDLFYDKRSDFAHGDIVFPNYYESKRISNYWFELNDTAQKSLSILVMSIRKLVEKDAIKIIVDDEDNIVFEKHKTRC